MSTITTAAREYASRPADERYTSVPELIAAAKADRDRSKEVTYNWRDLGFRSVPSTSDVADRQSPVADRANYTIELVSPKGAARMTHWAFGQVCRTLEAPAGFMRDSIPADIAVQALNYRIGQLPPATDAVLLVKAPNGNPNPIVRACTSDSYARVWDAELYGALHQQIMQHDDRWQLPPTWEGGADGPRAGAYRGDRDSFVIVVNGGSIVTDPSVANGSGEMFRGILVRNSEVGASSVVIESILFRYICGNHMLWGAVSDRKFRRRHIGSKTTRDVTREIVSMAYNYTTSSAARDEAIIKGLIEKEIAHTKEGVIDELRKLGASKEDAARAYDRCEQTERVSPRSFWGAAQGLTRISQDEKWQDARYVLDQIAAATLAKGRKLITV